MPTALRIAVASIALTGLALVGAVPASAAPRALPTTDAMFAISCDDTAPMQLFGVDASTGASTLIGTGNGTTDCAGQPAWDATTDTAYYPMFDFPQSILAKMDTATGSTTTVGIFTDSSVEPVVTPFVQAIAIGLDGSAYAYTDEEFYSLDLTTAAITPLGAVATEILGFAVDPTIGLFYATDTSANVYSVDVTNGSLTLLDTLALGAEPETYSLQIDSAGTFWYSSYEKESDVNQLWSTTGDLAGTEELSGPFTLDGVEYFHEALLIAPAPAAPAAPALADTGSSSSNALPIGVGALGLLLLGAGLVVIRRRGASA